MARALVTATRRHAGLSQVPATTGVLRRALERCENVFDRVFTPAWNPLYQLGALGWFFYWVVIVSGIYLYVFFDTGIQDAYDSLQRITYAQWYAGGVMRSLHRYASDWLVVVMVLHLAREFVLGRYRGARWVAWFTGVPIVWLVLAAGVSGYWLVWDRLAQYVATAMSEWLDALPLFGEPIARNFVDDAALSGRFFTLMVFIHIFVPLFLLFLMWIHVQRLSRPKVNPPKGLALGTLVALTALSLVHPAVSQGRADLTTVPETVGIDWFYLFALPLQDHYPGVLLWALAAAITLAVAVVPWLPPRRQRAPAARVDLDNCNGCARCAADCPYSAITMEPRSDGLAFSREAVVAPNLCVSCGICAGACPTATPFRRRTALVPGIELPDEGVADLTAASVDAAARLQGSARVLVYACRSGVTATEVDGDGVAVVELPCVGMLPPPLVDFVLSRRHADGVLLTGCREGDCRYRLGIRWTEERIARRRDPYLRARVPRERIATAWVGRDGEARLREALAGFRARLGDLDGDGDRDVAGSAVAALAGAPAGEGG